MSFQKQQYDTVIIGAGIGGLTCGTLLAQHGQNVLIAEQADKPGGYCCSFKRKGFTFNAGFDFLHGCEQDSPIACVLRDIGVMNRLHLIAVNTPIRIIGDDYDIPVNSIESFSSDLKTLVPGESSAIDNFFGECRALSLQMNRLMKNSPELMSLPEKISLLSTLMFRSPTMRKYQNLSTRSVLDRFFQSKKLKTILASVMPFHPGCIASLLMRTLGGESAIGLQPAGGAQSITNAIALSFSEYGGTMALNSRVKRIMVENNRAKGVEMEDGSYALAHNVVANCDATATFFNLVGADNLPSHFIQDIERWQPSDSGFLVSLGVDMNLEQMGFSGETVVYNRCCEPDSLYQDNIDTCYLKILMKSINDPSLAPEGMNTVQLFSPFSCRYENTWNVESDGTRGPHYQETKLKNAKTLIESAESLIPGLSSHIVCQDIATPLTFARRTGNTEGSVMGWVPLPGEKLKSQRTPVKNLYQAGAWTFPGASLGAVILSGKFAGELVLKG